MKISKTGRTIVAASLVLTSCAAPGGTTVPQMTRVAYYPQCYQSVALLRQQDQQFQQTMAVNTLAGAAGGAALGALASGGDWRGALIASDMYHDSGELQRAVIAARQADFCYSSAYNELVANLRSGAVSKPEAAQHFAEIDQGEHEVAAILAEYGKKTTASVQQYEVAFNQEAQRLNTTPAVILADVSAPPPPSAAQTPAPRPATRQVSENTRQLAQNYSKINQQVSEINQEQSSIERTATARRNDMQSLGVEIPA